MAVVNVTDSFFDITLSSNSFQDIFPSNTVSSFRAKLPVTLMFPPNVKFKGALHKLTFINSINNIGKGANTKIWISQKSANPVEVFLPDISIDPIDEFSHFLAGQLYQAAPEYFPKSHSKRKRAISISKNGIEEKRRKRNAKIYQQTINEEELPQGAAPIDDDLSSNGSIEETSL